MSESELSEQTYESTFSVGQHAELTLRNVRGSIEVTGWDRPEVSIVAVKRIGSEWGARESFDQTTVEMTQDGRRVMVRTSRPGPGLLGWMGIGRMPPQVFFTIKVPATSEVSVRTVDGPIKISNIIGSVYARTVGSDIQLEHVGGQVILSGVSARVMGTEVAGTVGAKTVSGDVTLTQSRLSSFWGKSVDGTVSLETTIDPAGTYDLHTVSGSFHLLVPPSSKLSAQMRGVSGRGMCDLPAQVNQNMQPGRSEWRAVVNGGGAALAFKTVSGDLTIGVSSKLPSAAPEAPAPAAPEAEAPRQWPEMSILKAVERGEMSVEDAVARLAELDKES